MDTLSRVKRLLEIEDDLQDVVLTEIIQLTEDYLRAFVGAEADLSRASFIILEVVVRRYNRLGSEGYTSKSIDGLSMAFQSNDFEEFMPTLKVIYPEAFNKSGVKFI